jgi:serine/threonine protein kinase
MPPFRVSISCRLAYPLPSDSNYFISNTPGPPLDVWAMGVILFSILCGRLPFEGSRMQMSKRPMEAIIKEKIIKCQYTLTDTLSNDAKVMQATVSFESFPHLLRISCFRLLLFTFPFLFNSPPYFLFSFAFSLLLSLFPHSRLLVSSLFSSSLHPSLCPSPLRTW